MAVPTFPTLGAPTLNRQWVYEVNTGTIGSPVWTMLGGVHDSQFQPDAPNMVSDTDQEGRGFQSSTKTGATWTADVTVIRRVGTDPKTYDVGQEFVRTHSIGQFGTLNTVQIRVSEFDPNDAAGVATPRVEAYTGNASASWVPQGGDMVAENLVKISLQGQGQLLVITHPYPATPAVPLITSVSPVALAVAGGQLVSIKGSGFTGTTGITIAATAAPVYSVENDGSIVVVSPSHSAGSGPVVVTNATGPSTTGATVTYS